MRAEYVQRGESINYYNTGEAAIFAGSVVVLGKRVGIAGCDIPPDGLGSAHIVGVFSFPKSNSSTEFKIGDEVFYDTDGAAASGDVKLGWVVEPSASGTANVLVKI